MQHAHQPRERIIRINRAEPIWPRHLRPPRECIVAEPEIAARHERRWRRQRLQAIQRIVHIRRRSALRVGERRAVRRFVVSLVRGSKPTDLINDEVAERSARSRADNVLKVRPLTRNSRRKTLKIGPAYHSASYCLCKHSPLQMD